jgi:hypothetical protein
MAKKIVNKAHAKRIIEEATRRAAKRKSLDPENLLFGPQKKFVEDSARNKVAVCSRRAGKSYSIAFMLLTHAMKHERSINPYITLTRDSGKDILWPALHDLNDKLSLKLRFRENTGDIILPNKSKIIIRGADDKRQIEKLRGPKYPIAVIDEAQGFPHFLHDLIEDVLEPATLDYDGQIVVTGTPNSACAGPFYELTTQSDGWSVHNWTLRDNPHIPNVEDWLDRKRNQKGWDDNHPTYLREYCGVWIRDASCLVFEYSPRVNLISSVPFDEADDWAFVLGIDLGFNDPTAFVVIAYSQDIRQAFVVESYKESGLIPSAVAAHVEGFLSQYPFTRIVADTGGFGKGYAEEMKKRFSIPVVAAQKNNKHGYIEMINGDFRTGSLQICGTENAALLDEISLLQWDLDRMERGQMVMDRRRFQNHLCDAMLYAWRECTHQIGEFQHDDEPEYGTNAYWMREAERMEQEEMERFEEESETPWWSL